MTAAFSRLPKALLLDIDNTVYPYEPCHSQGLKSAFAQARRLDLWDHQQAFHEAYDGARCAVKSRIRSHAAGHSRLLYFKEMLEGLRGFTLFDETCRLEQAYWDGFRTALAPEPECERVLQHALESGIRIAWVSNFTTARQIWKLNHLGLGRLKSLLVTSEEAGADKPDPKILDLALARLGLDAGDNAHHQAWLIGDETADVEAARHRHLPVLLMCRKRTSAAAEGLEYPVLNWQQIGEVLEYARN